MTLGVPAGAGGPSSVPGTLRRGRWLDLLAPSRSGRLEVAAGRSSPSITWISASASPGEAMPSALQGCHRRPRPRGLPGGCQHHPLPPRPAPLLPKPTGEVPGHPCAPLAYLGHAPWHSGLGCHGAGGHADPPGDIRGAAALSPPQRPSQLSARPAAAACPRSAVPPAAAPRHSSLAARSQLGARRRTGHRATLPLARTNPRPATLGRYWGGPTQTAGAPGVAPGARQLCGPCPPPAEPGAGSRGSSAEQQRWQVLPSAASPAATRCPSRLGSRRD